MLKMTTGFNATYPNPGSLHSEAAAITAAKVLEMFNSQYTEQLADRKADIIVRFCRTRKDGFYYEEINELLSIIELAIRDLVHGKYQN
jgi:hypothetical protein